MKRFSPKLLLGGIVLLAAVLRFSYLSHIPHSINGDQIHYLLSAKSFALTGKNITQTVTPLDIFLFRYPLGEVVQAELPYLLDMLSVGWLPFSMFANALPNALLGIGIVIVMYLFTKELFKDEGTAFIAAFLSGVNPWFISMSRTSYEIIPATFFFLLAGYLLLRTKGWGIVSVFPILLLAFYSYIGTKLIFLPLLLAYILYCYFYVHKRKYLVQYLSLFFLSTLVVLFFAFQLLSHPGGARMSDILTPNTPAIAQEVDALRKSSLQNPLVSLFINKITVYGGTLLAHAFAVFAPMYLFVRGDYFFSLFQFGVFYPMDLLFVLVGGVWLFVQKRRVFFFLITTIGIGIVPQIVHQHSADKNFTPHITMMIPFFIMAISAGVMVVYSYLQKRKILPIFGLLILVYGGGIAGFLYTYFFQLPVRPDFFNFPSRVLASYVQRVGPQESIVVYTQAPVVTYKEYVFYTNALEKESVGTIADSLKEKKYHIGNVQFVACDKRVTAPQKKGITIVQGMCDMDLKRSDRVVSIAQLADSGRVYTVFGDKVCGKYAMQPYLVGVGLHDLAPEGLSDERFCTKLLVR